MAYYTVENDKEVEDQLKDLFHEKNGLFTRVIRYSKASSDYIKYLEAENSKLRTALKITQDAYDLLKGENCE